MPRIMVCDDDAALLDSMAAAMANAGHQVSACSSGLEVLSKLGIRPEDPSVELPDLLVLDIMMPRTDGYAVGALIRGHARTRDLPILVISALSEIKQVLMNTIRVDGFLTKPFAPDDLLGSVAKIVERHGTPA